ncbi:MAG: hypothetical protein JRH11_23130 [Deltaproteobacteria bacterium]|nr:hypothetical protein [Deltaproteobacteria bacterium]
MATPHRSIRDIDFSAAPALGGHGLAETRPLAATILETSRGEPLLSHWHRGVGQVATFTSATTGGWADGWRTSEIFHTFWSQLAWSLMRARTVDPLELRFDEIPGAEGRVRVIAVAPTVNALPAPDVRIHRAGTGTMATTADDPGMALELEALGPGIFAGEVAVGGGFLAVARMPMDPEPTAAIAYDRTYDPELARFGHDDAALARLAEIGGGTVLSDPAEALEDVVEAPVSTPLSMWLFLAALLSYLVSVLLLRLPDDAAAKAAAAKIARPSRWSEPPDEPGIKPRKRRWTPGKNKKSRKEAA